MKRRVCYIVILLTVLSAPIACIRPIGKCEYGEHPVTRIDVVVSSIKFCEKGSKGKDCVLVEVRGKVDKGFYYSEEEYRKLVKKVKLKVGSRGILMIFSGGPCPPMYQLQFPD